VQSPQTLQQLPGCSKIAVPHIRTYAEVIPTFQDSLLMPMHIMWNYKVSMLYSWLSKASVLSMPSPLGCSVVVGCDNLGALHQAQQIQELTPCSSAHADLIRAICQVHQSIAGVFDKNHTRMIYHFVCTLGFVLILEEITGGIKNGP